MYEKYQVILIGYHLAHCNAVLGWLLYIFWSYLLQAIRCDMAFIEPMHRNKPNITYFATSYCRVHYHDVISWTHTTIDIYVLTQWITDVLFPDSKAHRANMGPIWGWQDPDGPHVGPMNIAIWVVLSHVWSTRDKSCYLLSLYFTVNDREDIYWKSNHTADIGKVIWQFMWMHLTLIHVQFAVAKSWFYLN